MPAGKYPEIVQRIIEAATTEPRENLVNRLTGIVNETTSPVAPVIALGALCYGKANLDTPMTEAEIAGLRAFVKQAQERGAAAQDPQEKALAEGCATLFTIVADQAQGKKLPTAEHRKAVVEARAKVERAEKGNNEPLFDVLAAAAGRFFPAKLREHKTKDVAIGKLNQLARLDGPEGTLARLLFAEHLMRRGQGKGLNAVATRLGQELPKAACVQSFQGAAAIATGSFEAAEQHLAKAFELNPADRAIRKGYAQILRANGKNEKAQQVEAG